MKKVLVVFPILHHESLVLGQCKYLNDSYVSIDAILICREKLKFYSTSCYKLPFSCRFLLLLFNSLVHIRGFYRFRFYSIIVKRLFHRLVEDHDTIELAGVYSEDRLYFAEYARSKGKKVISRVWGTDFYGIKDFQNDWRKELFRISDRIVLATEKMKNDFILSFPSFSTKLTIQPYGLSQLEQLKDILDNKAEKDVSFLADEYRDKIVLTIGYTGRTWQQHFYVLDALEKLSPDQKGKLFVLIPMTYDSIPDYRLYIIKRMQAIGIPFQILDKRLSLKQNLSMRIISDIAVCVQLSDGLSASVQEHIMAGSLFIGGDWLPYGVLQKQGIYMKLTSKDGLARVIGGVVDNIHEEKAKCRRNKDILYSFSSWKSIGNEFVNIYNYNSFDK